jgi:hypothetical protein
MRHPGAQHENRLREIALELAHANLAHADHRWKALAFEERMMIELTAAAQAAERVKLLMELQMRILSLPDSGVMEPTRVDYAVERYQREPTEAEWDLYQQNKF